MKKGKRGIEESSGGGGMHLARYLSRQRNVHVSIIGSSKVVATVPLNRSY